MSALTSLGQTESSFLFGIPGAITPPSALLPIVPPVKTTAMFILHLLNSLKKSRDFRLFLVVCYLVYHLKFFITKEVSASATPEELRTFEMLLLNEKFTLTCFMLPVLASITALTTAPE